MSSNDTLQLCFERIDAINAKDPNRHDDGTAKALLYGQRMSDCLQAFVQEPASHCLQIAVRAQHIQRWHLARVDFPAGRQGYLSWRRELAKHHAKLCTDIMAELAYSEADQERSSQLLRKQKLKQDPECQTLEDVACLVFLEFYFVDFARSHSDEKIISIVKKTWAKMSEDGHTQAMKIPYDEQTLGLIQQALA